MDIKTKIELLKSSGENALTESTVRNLARQILAELVIEEKFEQCSEIVEIEKKQLERFMAIV